MTSATARLGDVLLIHNETNLQPKAACIANVMRLRVFYYSARFDAATAGAILPFIDTLLLNAIEAERRQKFFNSLFSHSNRSILSSRAGQSAGWTDTENHHGFDVPAVRVTPGDTTGAGDTPRAADGSCKLRCCVKGHEKEDH